MNIAEPQLRKVVHAILGAGGSDEHEAELVTDHLVRANLAGHDSHGVGMVPTYVKHLKAGLLKPNTAAEKVKDEGAILAFDGRRGYGQRVALEAVDAAIKRCRETGLVLMSLRDAHHIGRIGTYGERAIDAGLVSLHFVNVTDHRPLVAPFGGTDARFGTNPICIAMPGGDVAEPLLLDMATSKIALGKTRVAMNRGVQVDDGRLLDGQGKPTNDPNVMFNEPYGALLPLGDHKGYGLAMFCELLGGVLSGGGTIQPGHERLGSIVNNMLTFVIDPAKLVDIPWMRAEIDATVRYFKASPPAHADKPVLSPGDPERRAKEVRQREGIPLADRAWEGILAAGEEVGFSREEAEALRKA